MMHFQKKKLTLWTRFQLEAANRGLITGPEWELRTQLLKSVVEEKNFTLKSMYSSQFSSKTKRVVLACS